MFTFINNLEDLKILNKELLSKPFVGLDTEFRRTTKDNMKIALLQINDTEEIYLIDCVQIKEPGDACSFLSSQDVKKVFHSCREDLEAIFSWSQLELVNLFDTQLANAFLGGSFSMSYQGLVDQKLGIMLDKKETRTNWLRRPLTDSQLNYAASDVQFLLELYEEQKENLIKFNKIEWFEEELASISSKALLNPDREVSDERFFNLTRAEEKNCLNQFNEIVNNISENEDINPTLFFSKKSQKDFLRLIQDLGLDSAFQELTTWRKNLAYEPISMCFENFCHK